MPPICRQLAFFLRVEPQSELSGSFLNLVLPIQDALALGRGRAARYTEQHVLRARVIGQLRSKRLPLRDIRAQLGRLTDEQMVAMLPRPRAAHLTPEGLPQPPPAPSYPSVTWEVVALMEGLVLMVNSSKAPGVRRVADDIYRHYSVPPARTT